MRRRRTETSLKRKHTTSSYRPTAAVRRLTPHALPLMAAGVFIAAVVFTFITGQWRSPANVARVPAETLKPAEEVLFQLVDTSFGRLKLAPNGQVPLNSVTEAALVGAVAELPPNISAETMNRLQFLIRQSVPGPLGEQFGALLREYYGYKQLEARELGPPPQAPNIDVEWDRFQKTVALQYRYFGAERARRLFGEHHALARYMFALRRVEADPRLSEKQRLAKQLVLQKQYERQRGGSAMPLATSASSED